LIGIGWRSKGKIREKWDTSGTTGWSKIWKLSCNNGLNLHCIAKRTISDSIPANDVSQRSRTFRAVWSIGQCRNSARPRRGKIPIPRYFFDLDIRMVYTL
jgi:hypothetical protein